jgi:hypothetical protein
VSEFNADILAVSNCFRTDSSSDIRKAAAAFLAILLQIYDPRDKQKLYLPTGGVQAIEEVRAEIDKTYGASFRASTEAEQELERKLAAWLKRVPYGEASGSRYDTKFGFEGATPLFGFIAAALVGGVALSVSASHILLSMRRNPRHGEVRKKAP